MQTLKEFYAQRPTATLYHYSDAAGTLGILGGKSFWATHIRYLNDSKEFAHANKLASNYVNEKLKTTQDDNERRVYEHLLARLEIMPGNNFIVSLSERGDLLSQWRGYCPRGGMSIGLNPTVLGSLADQQLFTFVRCSYDRQEQINLVQELIDNTVQEYKASHWLYADGADKYTEASNFCGHHFFPKMHRLGSAMKDPAFSEECEWRLIGGLKKSNREVKFRAKGSVIIPYQSFDLGEKVRDLLTEVIIGPSSQQGLSREGLDRFLLAIQVAEASNHFPTK
ncbi:MAG: hypothetical protein JWO31_375, partial [Phycisphaerales bacterium]|nr:hypothetical protein [Phycisphaerales bacterium]